MASELCVNGLMTRGEIVNGSACLSVAHGLYNEDGLAGFDFLFFLSV